MWLDTAVFLCGSFAAKGVVVHTGEEETSCPILTIFFGGVPQYAMFYYIPQRIGHGNVTGVGEGLHVQKWQHLRVRPLSALLLERNHSSMSMFVTV